MFYADLAYFFTGNRVKWKRGDQLMQRLKELRKKRHLSQRQVADALHIDQASYSRLESSERALISSMVIALAEFYQVSCDTILGYTPKRNLYLAEELIRLAAKLSSGEADIG